MVVEKVAPRNVEGKRCQRGQEGKGERKSLEPFPDAQLAMQIPSDEDDVREWNKEEEEGEKSVLECRGCELDWRRLWQLKNRVPPILTPKDG